jgi:Caspase domain
VKPWVEGPAAAGAPATHALVIGVSRYEFLPQGEDDPSPTDRETFDLRQARTPATSAWRFANWLASEYRNATAPLGTVRLLLSPSAYETQAVAELGALPVEVLPATRDNVVEAVDDWYAASATSADNVAILYASGHGIQMSKDDGGIVLLEDFARRPTSPLDHSLDVPAVRKGMAGTSMAQCQFYFVDACRVRPEAAANFQTMGTGVGLQNPFEGAPRCSAVYFSASPSTEALGEPGEGTLFVQALLDCLRLLAVDDHARDGDQWVVTTGTLMQALPKRVSELAGDFGVEQAATTGGQLEDVPFHVLPERPCVPLTLALEPAGAVACATARLWDGIETSVFEDVRFQADETAVLERPVPAGQYVLTITIDPPTPPFRNVPALPVPALPPYYTATVRVG